MCLKDTSTVDCEMLCSHIRIKLYKNVGFEFDFFLLLHCISTKDPIYLFQTLGNLGQIIWETIVYPMSWTEEIDCDLG